MICLTDKLGFGELFENKCLAQTTPQRVSLSVSEILLRERKRADTKSRSKATKESIKEFW